MVSFGNYGGQTGQASGLKGTGLKSVTQQQFTPEQMQLFQQAFGHLGPESFLGKLSRGGEENFKQLEAPALRQFGQLQGEIASRFSGAGLGGRRGSGFQNTLNSATQEFAERLQSQRLGLQQQAVRDLLGLSGSLLQQRPYESALIGKKKPFWQELLGGSAPSLGQAGGMWALSKLGLLAL